MTIEEVEEVLTGHQGRADKSDSSGDPIIFGTTSTGKRIAVVFEIETDPDYVIVRPLTAYPVPEYGDADGD